MNFLPKHVSWISCQDISNALHGTRQFYLLLRFIRKKKIFPLQRKNIMWKTPTAISRQRNNTIRNMHMPIRKGLTGAT